MNNTYEMLLFSSASVVDYLNMDYKFPKELNCKLCVQIIFLSSPRPVLLLICFSQIFSLFILRPRYATNARILGECYPFAFLIDIQIK